MKAEKQKPAHGNRGNKNASKGGVSSASISLRLGDLLPRIDRARGSTPRSDYIRDALNERLERDNS